MKALISAIFDFITRHFNLKDLLFGAWVTSAGFQQAASIAYKTLLIAALAFFVNYIVRIWNLFADLIKSFKTLGANISGESYGISNSAIVNSFWGFVHESGLDDVVLTSGTLFISLLSAFFGIQAYKLFLAASKEAYTMATDGTKIIPKP